MDLGNTEVAMMLVRANGVTGNLRPILEATLRDQPQLADLVKAYGPSAVSDALHLAIEEVRAATDSSWRQVWANAYRAHLSRSEIRSLVIDGASSPVQEKLASLQPAMIMEVNKDGAAIITSARDLILELAERKLSAHKLVSELKGGR